MYEKTNGYIVAKDARLTRQTTGWDVAVVADYGKGDGAFTEVHLALRSGRSNLVPDWETPLKGVVSNIEAVSVEPFSTLSTGFWIRQLGVEDGYPGLAIFSNTAPRGTEDAIAWQGDGRQRLWYGQLKNGVPIFAVNSGYNWSFVRDELESLYDLRIPNEGTQFRSRDSYAPAAARILAGDTSFIGRELDPKEIPAVPTDRIVYIDGYDNIKLSLRESGFPEQLRGQQRLWIDVNGIGREVHNHLSGARAPVGGLSLTDGSSGSVGDRHLELVLRGGRAAELFGLNDRQVGGLVRPDDRTVNFSAVGAGVR